jgi:hypothetical protein
MRSLKMMKRGFSSTMPTKPDKTHVLWRLDSEWSQVNAYATADDANAAMSRIVASWRPGRRRFELAVLPLGESPPDNAADFR